MPADTEAVGVPDATFKKANLAEDVVVPPINTSFVALFG